MSHLRAHTFAPLTASGVRSPTCVPLQTSEAHPGFQGGAWRSGDQGTDERGEKLLASCSGIVNKLEEPKIDREFFL